MVFWVVLKRGLEMTNSIKIWGDRDVATVALSMLDGGVTLATIDIWAPMVAYSYFTPKADQKAISAAGQYVSQVVSVEERKQLWHEAGRKFGAMRIADGGQLVICRPSKVISRNRTMKGVIRVKKQREEAVNKQETKQRELQLIREHKPAEADALWEEWGLREFFCGD